LNYTYGNFCFNSEGSLCFEADFTTERELVIWIVAEHINTLLLSLDIPLELMETEEGRDLILGKLNKRFITLKKYTDWLEKNHIPSDRWG